MSDSFSKEVEVSNLISRYFEDNAYSIVQLICPGAQASLSIRYTNQKGNRKVLAFPDVIAIKDDTIYIGEMKPKFSVRDKAKLLDMKYSIDAEEKIKNLLSRIVGLSFNDHKLKFILIHGDQNAKSDELISQIIVTTDSTIMLTVESDL